MLFDRDDDLSEFQYYHYVPSKAGAVIFALIFSDINFVTSLPDGGHESLVYGSVVHRRHLSVPTLLIEDFVLC